MGPGEEKTPEPMTMLISKAKPSSAPRLRANVPRGASLSSWCTASTGGVSSRWSSGVVSDEAMFCYDGKRSVMPWMRLGFKRRFTVADELETGMAC
jgi:hypothetical protein